MIGTTNLSISFIVGIDLNGRKEREAMTELNRSNACCCRMLFSRAFNVAWRFAMQ